MLGKEEALGYQAQSVPPLPNAVHSSREADHRIANSLMLVATLLRAQAKDLAKQPVITGADAKNALDAAAARVDAIGELHRTISSEAPLTCAAYIRRIGEAVGRIGPTGSVATLRYDLANDLSLDPSRLAALGMLTSEALINALKYAHPAGVAGAIMVSCRKIGAECVLVIEDDGVGLPDGFNPATDGGLGLRTMRQLALQLKARMNHRSTPLGLRIEVLFAL